MSTYANLPAPSPEQGLNRYLQEIRKFPMLEPEEEYMLAKRWVDRQDTDAAHKLVTSHLRLAAKIAMGYRGYGLPQAEVISEANVGLMQAVKRFDPEKGFRLATYAMWWIRASIQEYILRSWSLVKLGTTSGQKKLFFNLRKAKARLGALEEGDMRPENVRQIATDLGVTEDEVISMNRRLSGGDASLNAQIGQEGEGTTQWQDWLEDEEADQASALEESDEMQLAAPEDRAREESIPMTAQGLVLEYSERPPQIKGGLGNFYIHIEYPPEAVARSIEGRLLLSFFVDTEGRPQDIEVMKSLHPLCDSAAVRASSCRIRVISSFPCSSDPQSPAVMVTTPTCHPRSRRCSSAPPARISVSSGWAITNRARSASDGSLS